jgi:hypothetical protein
VQDYFLVTSEPTWCIARRRPPGAAAIRDVLGAGKLGAAVAWRQRLAGTAVPKEFLLETLFNVVLCPGEELDGRVDLGQIVEKSLFVRPAVVADIAGGPVLIKDVCALTAQGTGPFH